MADREHAAALRNQLDKFEKLLAGLTCIRMPETDNEGRAYPKFPNQRPSPCPHCKALAMIEEIKKELGLFDIDVRPLGENSKG